MLKADTQADTAIAYKLTKEIAETVAGLKEQLVTQ